MKQYIDKSALLAELNRLIAELVEEGEDTMFEQGRISAFEDVKVFINHTLEVKEVEEESVSKDLEEAAKNYEEDAIFYAARRISDFFKAGAKWQKEQGITKACEWLLKNDSYAKPTDLLVRDFKKAMEE